MADLQNWILRQQQELRKKSAAWGKATIVAGYDATQIRKDAYGSFIKWGEHGKLTAYGWEIDHELPKSLFPSIANETANLRALHWKNNRAKSNLVDIKSITRLLGGLQ